MYGNNDYVAKGRAAFYSGAAKLSTLSFGRPSGQPVRVTENGLKIGQPELARRLENYERGAVISPENCIRKGKSDEGVTIEGVEFDPDVVRAALLFFDRLDYPANSFIQVGEECPRGLEGWDGFQRSRVPLSGSLTDEIMPIVVGEVFHGLNQREEGMWAIARGPSQSFLTESDLSPLSAFKMRLENALPIPDRAVPYDEVLSFKARHSDELAALRAYIDEFAVDVSRGGFTQYQQTVAFEKFDRALGDYYRVARQANFLKRLTSVEISFSLTDAAKGVLAAFSGGTVSASALPSLESAAIGAAMGLSLSMGLTRKSEKNEISPFDYVFRAGVEM